MPDIKILTNIDNDTVIEIPKFNDSTSGINSLAQTAALMLLDPNYGNLKSMIKNRIENIEIQEVVLRAIDQTEEAMVKEQGNKIMATGEILAGLEIESISVTKDSVYIILIITNTLNEETTINI